MGELTRCADDGRTQILEDGDCARSCAKAVHALVSYALGVGLIEQDDVVWARNQLFALVGLPGEAQCAACAQDGAANFPHEALDELVAALKARLRDEAEELVGDGDEGLRAQVMAALMPRPSEVARRFHALHDADPQRATDYLYRLSCDADYVKVAAIARNEQWVSPTKWGDLQITINLSKPEKDPRAIARAANSAGAAYPSCALCWENEGYAGRGFRSPQGAHAARQNLRIVPIELGGERWGLQYSPYAYYNEHCIVLSSEHRPMHVDRGNLQRLLEFVDRFPHYFVGSNADLPVVGGSILSHDHFQGGRHVFPLDEAPIAERLRDSRWPDVEIGVVMWPTTVLRLSGAAKENVLDAACALMDAWRDWDDESVGIVSHDDDGTRHNTITPIARKLDGRYRLDIALRCNIASDEHPLGVFHPHEELHHIKRENIGLIEVMGLAILPARLKRELAAVAAHVTRSLGEGLVPGGTSQAAGWHMDALFEALRDDEACAAHAKWACAMVDAHPELTEGNVSDVIRQEVALTFAKVLEDTGVFKWDESGRRAFGRFARAAGLVAEGLS